MSEIPTFGEALKAAVRGTLRSWGRLRWLSRNLWDSGKEFAWDALLLVVALAGPLLVPLSPLIAWVYQREMRKEVERRKALRERMQKEFTRGAGGEA